MCHQISFWEATTQKGITEFKNFLLQLKRSKSKTGWGFSNYLNFERNYSVLKSNKESMHFVEQKYKL